MEFSSTIERQRKEKLQLIDNARDRAKTIDLPTAPVRALIYELYVREERDELQIAANLKIPVASVRLTLRGYQEIARRSWQAARAERPAWARTTEAEIAAEVWGEFGGKPTGGGARVVQFRKAA